MHTAWLRILLLSASLAAFASAQDKGGKKDPGGAAQSGAGHMKEELGVNQFTTPGIDLVLQSLRDLRPLRYEEFARDLPAQPPEDRALLALSTGGVIADGFFAVVAEKQSRLEPIGRALLAHARGLGVGDHVVRHTKSILQHAAEKDWDRVRSELAGAQRDVEKGMMALRDEEIAHLVALGGWWRGLEVASGILADSYTPERARILVQPGLLSYFADRLETLNPRIKARAPFPALASRLGEVRALIETAGDAPPGVDGVKKLHTIAKTMNAEIASPAE